MRPCDFERLLHFMYYGQVRIPNGDLESLIMTAKSLRIKGLSASSSHFPQEPPLQPHPHSLPHQQEKPSAPVAIQDEPQNYSVNNNNNRSPTPPPPPPPPLATTGMPAAVAAAAGKESCHPTPPKKRRLSAMTGKSSAGDESTSKENDRVDDQEINTNNRYVPFEYLDSR